MARHPTYVKAFYQSYIRDHNTQICEMPRLFWELRGELFAPDLLMRCPDQANIIKPYIGIAGEDPRNLTYALQNTGFGH